MQRFLTNLALSRKERDLTNTTDTDSVSKRLSSNNDNRKINLFVYQY